MAGEICWIYIWDTGGDDALVAAKDFGGGVEGFVRKC